MSRYKVKEKDFETPPENIYWMDLVGIDEMEGRKGPFLRWRWIVSEVPGQEQFAGVYVTSITPMTATTNNRFGHFLKVLLGNAGIGSEGDTDSLVDGKYRVKGFVEHNKRIEDGEDVIYCNVSKLLEGSGQAGAGIGRQDMQKKGKDEGKGGSQSKPASSAGAGASAQPQPTGDIPW